MTKSEKLAEKYAELRSAFTVAYEQGREQMLQAVQDRRFYSIPGAQWEGALGVQFANRPRFEINKVQQSVIRIFSEYRNNRISVDFRSANDDHGLSETLDGLLRSDEQRSGAQHAYDNAFEEAVGGGVGAWRLRAEYSDEYDEDDDSQRICIAPIYDADTCVVWDIDAKAQDKSDAKRCWVLTSMSRDAYIATYDDDPASWPKDEETSIFDWCKADLVWVAEAYEVDEQARLFHYFKGLDGVVIKVAHEDLEDQEERLLATGYVQTKQRRIKSRIVRKYIMGGADFLDDPVTIAGKHIPVVPVYGKRWFVDGIERYSGHVRNAKDSQRLKNMQVSRLAEIAALSPIEKPIFTAEQIQGYGLMWSEDNIKNYPYALVNPVMDANGQMTAVGPLGYTKPPQVPPAMAALLQVTEQDMQDVLGNNQRGEQVQSNVSAKAVELVQNRLDMQTFIYTDNMAIAMKRCGEVWLSMAKDLYVEDGRKMEVVGLQGDASMIELRRPMLDKKTGATIYENDIANADHSVVVDVGPSFTTRRDSTVRALTGMMQVIGASDQALTGVLAATAVMNMDGEGLDDVRAYLRQRLIRQGVVKPNDAEKAELAEEQQNTPPDPQAEYLKAAAAEAAAKADKAQADTILAVAKAEQTKAETVETLSNVDGARQRQVIEAVNAITGA